MTAKTNNQTSIVLGSKAGLQKFLDNPKTASMIKAVAGKYLTAERITKMILLAATRQPKLFDCTPRSFLDACVKSAELGLDFGGATGQAYLVPFRNGPLSKKHNRTVLDCTFIPGYQGLIELCYRGGSATYVDAQLVYQKDKFKYNLGSEPRIVFEPNLDEEDRGDVKCAFAAIRLKDSPYPKLEIMTKKQLLAIKDRSKAKDSGPWQTDEPEMMRKTVLRRALKYIPKTPEIEQALEADNQLYDIGLPSNHEAGLGVDALKERIDRQQRAKDEPERFRKAKKVDAKSVAAEPSTKQTEQTEQPTAKEEPTAYHCSYCVKDYKSGKIFELEKAEDGKLTCPECGYEVKAITPNEEQDQERQSDAQARG